VHWDLSEMVELSRDVVGPTRGIELLGYVGKSVSICQVFCDFGLGHTFLT
jgi:hypothetical protein